MINLKSVKTLLVNTQKNLDWHMVDNNYEIIYDKLTEVRIQINCIYMAKECFKQIDYLNIEANRIYYKTRNRLSAFRFIENTLLKS